MSVQGPIPVEFGAVFPSGAYAAGAFDPVRNFDASTGEKFVQSTDKATGMPLWVIEVIDPDPQARTRAVKVKVAAQVQPVIPAGPSGSPFTPVEFTGMTVTPYVNQAGRLAYSIKATGIRAPGRGRPGPESKGGGGMRSGGGSFARIGLHVGADWWTFLNTYDEHSPILDIAAGSTTVTCLHRRPQDRRLGAGVRPGAGQPGGAVRRRGRAAPRAARPGRRHGLTVGGRGR